MSEKLATDLSFLGKDNFWFVKSLAGQSDWEAKIDSIEIIDAFAKARLKREVLIERTMQMNTVAYLHGVRMGSYYGTLTISYLKRDARSAEFAWSFCKELQVAIDHKDLSTFVMSMDKFNRKIGRRLAATKFIEHTMTIILDPQNPKTQSQIFRALLEEGLLVEDDDHRRRISLEPVNSYLHRLLVSRVSAKLSEGKAGAGPLDGYDLDDIYYR